MALLGRRRVAFSLAVILGLMVLWWWVMGPFSGLHSPDDERSTSVPVPPSASAKAPQTVFTKADPTLTVASLHGRVLDAVTRAPVQEFNLELHRTLPQERGKPPQVQAFRSSEGRFEWQSLPPDSWMIVASAPGYQRFELSSRQAPSAGSPAEVVLPLRPGYKLKGRVYDESTRNGIAAANITFRSAGVAQFEGNWRSRVNVASGADGSFTADGLPAGRTTLHVTSQDFAEREVDVLIGEDTATVEIGLSTGGSISGRLTASDGVTAIAGQAGLYNLDRGFGGMGQTDKVGGFSYRNLVAGRYRITGQAQGSTASRDIVLKDNQRIEGLTLTLGGGRSIRGIVTGLRPEQLRQVRVSLRREGLEAAGVQGIAVDERGAYQLSGVEPGQVTVVAELMMQRQFSRTVRMPADADLTVNLEFPAGARLSGRVTYGGKPLRGVDVNPVSLAAASADRNLFVYGTSTGANGEYVVEDLPTGDYSVRFGRFGSRRVRVSDDTVVDVEIPAAQLTGKVLAQSGDLPIVGATVDLWAAGTKPGATRLRLGGQTDHFGQFTLDGVETGDFVLTVYEPGYEMYRDRISFSPPSADRVIRLRQDSGVEIKVRDAGTGKPLREVFAYEMVGDRNGMQLHLQLDVHGVGNIPGGLAGSTIAVAAEGYAAATIRDWNGQRLDLKLATAER